MIEANVEILEVRYKELESAALAAKKILHRFRVERAHRKRSGKPLTAGQKLADLSKLQDAHDVKDTANTEVDIAFNATEPIEE